MEQAVLGIISREQGGEFIGKDTMLNIMRFLYYDIYPSCVPRGHPDYAKCTAQAKNLYAAIAKELPEQVDFKDFYLMETVGDTVSNR
jgi:hypothetical protein